MKTRKDRLNQEQEQTFNKSFRVIKRILNQLNNSEKCYSDEYIELQEKRILKNVNLILELLKFSEDLNKETLSLLKRLNKEGYIYCSDVPKRLRNVLGITEEQIKKTEQIEKDRQLEIKRENSWRKKREYNQQYFKTVYKTKNKLRLQKIRSNWTEEQKEKDRQAAKERMRELRKLKKEYLNLVVELANLRFQIELKRLPSVLMDESKIKELEKERDEYIELNKSYKLNRNKLEHEIFNIKHELNYWLKLKK